MKISIDTYLEDITQRIDKIYTVDDVEGLDVFDIRKLVKIAKMQSAALEQIKSAQLRIGGFQAILIEITQEANIMMIRVEDIISVKK